MKGTVSLFLLISKKREWFSQDIEYHTSRTNKKLLTNNKTNRFSGDGGTHVSATDIMNVLLREDNHQTTEVLNVTETSASGGMNGASFDGKVVTLLQALNE